MEQKSKKWYAIYTKPKWEKKVDCYLTKKGIESYCPLQKIQRNWSDRKKIIEEPVFKSYLFVRIIEDERVSVLETNGVLNFVNFLRKPAIIKNEEIQLIKQFLFEQPLNIKVYALHKFLVDDKVIIRNGVFMDNIGTVIKTQAKRIYVSLETLGQMLVVEFHPSHAALLTSKYQILESN